MDLIIGGAYQGKQTYVRARYGLMDGDVFDCGRDGGLNVSRRCLCHLEEYELSCVRRGVEPVCAFRLDAVFICRDISCGIVPMDAEWREAVGRFLNRLGAQAEHVTRVFCSLPLALK